MKQKIIKKMLFCIPIGILLFTSVIKAEGVTQVTAKTSLHQITKIKIDLGELREARNMFSFSLDGVTSFCLDPDKGMTSGLEYVLSGEVETVYSRETAKAMKKAWRFYEKYKSSSDYNETGARIIAQIFIWEAQNGSAYDAYIGEIAKNVLMVVNGYSAKEASSKIDNMKRKIIEDYNKITDADISNLKLYVWEQKNGDGFQDLLTSYSEGKPDPEDNKCEIEVKSNLATCSDNSINTGIIRQYTKENDPDCVKGYTGENNNAYGKAVDVGVKNYCKLYCLENLYQNYPGNIKVAVNAGRYIVWPNNNIDNNKFKVNKNLTSYPMSLKVSQVCKLYVNSEVQTDYSKALKDIKDKRYYKKEDMLKVYLDDECDSLKKDMNDKKDTMEEEEEKLEKCEENPETKQEWKCYYSNNAPAPNTCTSGCTCGYYNVPVECDSSDYEDAEDAYDEAKSKYDSCTDVGKAYEKAINIIKSLNKCATIDTKYAVDFSVKSGFVSYNDERYGGSFELEVSSSTNNNCIGCTSTIEKLEEDIDKTTLSVFKSKVTEINNRIPSETYVTKTLDIKDGYYYYVDKLTNLSVHNKPKKNYSTIGFSNMPIAFDAKEGKYNLSLDVDIAGTAFDQEFNAATYTCSYKVTTNTPDKKPCICPEGTLHAGESIDCKVDKLVTEEWGQYLYTCSDGQTDWCDVVATTEICPPEYKCTTEFVDGKTKYYGSTVNKLVTENDYYKQCFSCVIVNDKYIGKGTGQVSEQQWYAECDGGSELYSCEIKYENNKAIYYGKAGNKLSEDDYKNECGCRIEGNTYYGPNAQIVTQQEYKKLCSGNLTLKCPNDPTGDTQMSKNFRSCVDDKKKTGKSEAEAKEDCYDKCQISSGIKIIYRTISLQNPFPSYDADSNSNKIQEGLTKGMFNTTIKGRYPGTNWNGAVTVNKKILNNRNTANDSIYTKEPLYTIILDSTKIKQIRKYNDQQKNKGGYSDFTLTCKMNNSAACISTFLRSTKLNLITDGTCKNTTKASKFYECDD